MASTASSAGREEPDLSRCGAGGRSSGLGAAEPGLRTPHLERKSAKPIAGQHAVGRGESHQGGGDDRVAARFSIGESSISRHRCRATSRVLGRGQRRWSPCACCSTTRVAFRLHCAVAGLGVACDAVGRIASNRCAGRRAPLRIQRPQRSPAGRRPGGGGWRPLDELVRQEVIQPLVDHTSFGVEPAMRSLVAPTTSEGQIRYGIVNDPNAAYLGGVAGHAALLHRARPCTGGARLAWSGYTGRGHLAVRGHGPAFLQLSSASGTRLLGWDTPDVTGRSRLRSDATLIRALMGTPAGLERRCGSILRGMYTSSSSRIGRTSPGEGELQGNAAHPRRRGRCGNGRGAMPGRCGARVLSQQVIGEGN